MTGEEFGPLWREHAAKIFDETQLIFRLHDWLSDEEREKAKALQANLGTPFRLRLGVFHQGAFVGWAVGDQESSETFYMRNSAILPAHRRKGLYTALMNRVVGIAVQNGFQKIYSRHVSTNNDVIIPKLKAGFFITGMEVTDIFGVLVHLSYFPKELRRKIMVFRAGDARPDDELRTVLKL